MSATHCPAHATHHPFCASCVCALAGVPTEPLMPAAAWQRWLDTPAPVTCTHDRNCTGARDRVCAKHPESSALRFYR